MTALSPRHLRFGGIKITHRLGFADPEIAYKDMHLKEHRINRLVSQRINSQGEQIYESVLDVKLGHEVSQLLIFDTVFIIRQRLVNALFLTFENQATCSSGPSMTTRQCYPPFGESLRSRRISETSILHDLSMY